MGQMEGTHGMASMDMGPLVVMNGDDMGIRVGSSGTNVMSMGAACMECMGSAET